MNSARDYKNLAGRAFHSLTPRQTPSLTALSASSTTATIHREMDSFAEPQRRQEYTLPEVREQVRRLEDEHRAKGIPLSGRIIHVCHYLPFSSSLKQQTGFATPNSLQPGIPSPPQTPPTQPSDIPPSPSTEVPPTETYQQTAIKKANDERWNVSMRYGHSAMVSGIASLASTHEELVVGWTGDIHVAQAPSLNGTATPQPMAERVKVPTKDISDADKEALERVVNAQGNKLLFKDDAIYPQDEGEASKNIGYVPVWLDDKQAHGHYDGYCKQSEHSYPTPSSLYPRVFCYCHFPYFRSSVSVVYGLVTPNGRISHMPNRRRAS